VPPYHRHQPAPQTKKACRLSTKPSRRWGHPVVGRSPGKGRQETVNADPSPAHGVSAPTNPPGSPHAPPDTTQKIKQRTHINEDRTFGEYSTHDRTSYQRIANENTRTPTMFSERTIRHAARSQLGHDLLPVHSFPLVTKRPSAIQRAKPSGKPQFGYYCDTSTHLPKHFNSSRAPYGRPNPSKSQLYRSTTLHESFAERN